MGRDASCELSFGIPLSNNYESDDDGGWVAPWKAEEFSGDIEEWVLRDLPYLESSEDAENARYEARRAARAAFGFQTVRSGCYEDEDHEVLCISESVIKGRWFAATEVDPANLIARPEWTERLKAFCDSIGMPWSEPKWYLTVLYG
jgi:hypothetical protein